MPLTKTIAVTPGDPAGVGPEVLLKALASPLPPDTRIVVVGPADFLNALLPRYAPSLRWEIITDAQSLSRSSTPILLLNNGTLSPSRATPGQPNDESAACTAANLDGAIDLAVQKKVHALVTGPVSKRSVQSLRPGFIGVTEYLGQQTHTRHPVMAFFSGPLRVALATTHVPLKKVPALLTADRIATTIKTGHEALQRFLGMNQPRIAVCGLNPHAGEGGLFGREEQTAIEPAIQLAKESGCACSGPYPADSLFHRAIRGEFDMVIAMYHDQGLGPVKTYSHTAVNVTLGLPFVRVSASHGTGYDIAGKGQADTDPMLQAIALAAQMGTPTAELF